VYIGAIPIEGILPKPKYMEKAVVKFERDDNQKHFVMVLKIYMI